MAEKAAEERLALKRARALKLQRASAPRLAAKEEAEIVVAFPPDGLNHLSLVVAVVVVVADVVFLEAAAICCCCCLK